MKVKDFENTLEFALDLDQADALKACRDQFYIPRHKGNPAIYFTGNSLGLQPKSVQTYITEELEAWRDLGVEGHFEGKRPWLHYHKNFKRPLSKLVGAKSSEVVSMNNLTTNIHVLMASFYHPTKDRFKILMEKGAFPSDQYAIETQISLKGFEPKDAIVEISPSSGHSISLDDIRASINEHDSSIALVFFSGVQYYTGQWFDIRSISELAHSVGAYAGFDLAHAIGNVPLSLHDHDADFASWCSYKYLNSGPGNVSGIFVHEKHGNLQLPRFGGWWGHEEKSRFLMEKGFKPMVGADGWQLSNVNVISSAAHLASLEIFDEVGMKRLREKSLLLTGYLEYIVHKVGYDRVSIITPDEPNDRGCQLSIVINSNLGNKIYDYLTYNGVVVDWREPDVIRVAPVPLYNSFEDVYRFGDNLTKALGNV